MEIIEIRDILDESGKTVFPRTHVDAVIGLKDTNFFEAVTDAVTGTTSIKLKSQYSGLWADGFVSAGGIGTGGGGGGGLITSVLGEQRLGTIYSPSGTENLTETFSAFAIDKIWQNSGSSLSLTSITQASYLKDSGGNFLLDSNGDRLVLPGSSSVTRLNLINGAGSILSSVDLDLDFDLSSYATKSWVTENYQPTISDLETIRTNATAGAEKVSNVQSDWNADTGLAVILNKPDLSIYALQTGLADVSSRLAVVENWFEVVIVGSDSALHAKNGYAIYSDSWIASGGIGSDGGGSVASIGLTMPTGFSVAGSPITSEGTLAVSFANGYSLPTTAKQDEWDGKSVVEVSNLLTNEDYVRVATITIDGVNYHIKAPTGGGGGGGTETDPIFTASAAYGISSADIANWNSKTSNVGTITGITMNGVSKGTSGIVDLGTVLTSIPDLSGIYVTTARAETISGAKTFSSTIAANGGLSINSGSVLEQNSGSTLVNYGARGTTSLNLYGTSINLMSRDSSGAAANLLAVQNNAIVVESKIVPNDKVGLDLGGSSATKRWSTIYGVDENLTGDLVMDSASTIQIGPVTIEYDSVNHALHVYGTDGTSTIGLYCDGFVAAGGVQTSS